MDCRLLRFRVTHEVKALAESLEEAYGGEIELKKGASDPAGDPIRAKIESTLKDGRLSLSIGIGEGCELYSLAHELLHVKLWRDGVPVSRACTKRLAEEWSFHVEGALQHHVIYPWLCQMDLAVDPYDNEDHNRKARDKIGWLFDERAADRWLRVVAVSNLHLLFTNETLLSELEGRARAADKGAWGQGKDLAQTVVNTGAGTCRSKTRAVKEICAVLRPQGFYGKVVLKTWSPKALDREVCILDG